MACPHLSVVVLLVLLGALVENQVDACSCMPAHPQERYCNSDFVIVARIRRLFKNEKEGQHIYKVKVKKAFKTSPKAEVALKAGRLFTAMDSAMCGLSLDVGRVYLLSGRVSGLQARLSLCDFARPWRDVTPRQRKGFRLIYSKGCDCKIYPNFYRSTRRDPNTCTWNNFHCQADHGICLRSPSGICNWSRSIDLKKCITGDLRPTALKPTDLKPKLEELEPYLAPYKQNPIASNQVTYGSRFKREIEAVNTEVKTS